MTLPPASQGRWVIGFSERNRQFFFFLLGRENYVLERKWDHPGSYRDIRDRTCRYTRRPPAGGAAI